MNLPIHPMLVHFPIAVYFVELTALIFYSLKNKEECLNFAKFSFRFAYLAMLAAFAVGVWEIGGFSEIGGKVQPHYYAALTLIVIQTGRGIYWQFSKMPNKNILLVTSLLGYAAVATVAYFGGLIVYG